MRFSFSSSLMLAAALACCVALPASAMERLVNVVAGSDNTFHLPNDAKVLYLKAGEQVHFHVTAASGGQRGRDGSVHSFTLRSLRDQGWDVRLKEGSQDFVLTAPAAGEYLVECAVKCGPGHDTMNFKMIVQ